MPELPEVETVKQGLSPHLIGNKVTKMTIRNHQLRWKVDQYLPDIIRGCTIKALRRRAKYLLIDTTHGTFIFHLGMSGSLVVVDQSTPLKKHDHIDIALSNQHILRYHDPRRFGALLWTDAPIEHHRLFNSLGPEPLSHAFHTRYFFKACQHRSQSIKKTMMTNEIVVGVGNIYANEVLFLAGIHPLTPAKQLSIEQCQRLVHHIKKTLRKAIRQGGTTLKDFKNSDGKPGYFKQFLYVYGRKELACLHCGEQLEEIRIDQRSTVFCPQCQSSA